MTYFFTKMWIGLSVFMKYRIGANWAPVLIRPPPHENPNRTPVKKRYWNNWTPSWIDPHPSYQYIRDFARNGKNKEYMLIWLDSLHVTIVAVYDLRRFGELSMSEPSLSSSFFLLSILLNSFTYFVKYFGVHVVSN